MHDCNGKVIRTGDVILVRFRVGETSPNPDHCNVKGVTIIPEQTENGVKVDRVVSMSPPINWL